MKFKKLLFIVVLFLQNSSLFSQNQDPTSIYRKERDKINNLVHTKLKVSFNFDQKELNGEEWLTLHELSIKISTSRTFTMIKPGAILLDIDKVMIPAKEEIALA